MKFKNLILISSLIVSSNLFADNFKTDVVSLAKSDNINEVSGFASQKETLKKLKNMKKTNKKFIKEKIKKEAISNPDYIIGLKQLKTIYFNVNSSCLYKENDIDNLKELVKEMKKKNYPNLFIIGTASPEGPVDYNNRLAEERAKSIKKFLIREGYPKSKINIAYKIYQENLPDKKEFKNLRKAIIYTVEN